MIFLRLMWLFAVFVITPFAHGVDAQGNVTARPFGYVVGDIITQRIPLQIGGKGFTPLDLPRTGRVGVSLWRRSAVTEIDANGENWLTLQYQIINAPQSLTVWQLPPLTLAGADPAQGALNVPPQPYSIGRFTPAEPFADKGFGATRPDSLPDPVPLRPLERQVVVWSSALVLTLLAWAASLYWHYWRIRQRLPFSAAAREILAVPDNSPEAWRRLQHALNQSAGQVIRPNNVDTLIDRTPYLAAERQQLQQFCEDARVLFFSGATPDSTSSVHKLAQRLKQLERRYAQ